MKIAFVFDGLGFGGIERVGIDYIKLCLQMGHEVDVYNLSPQYNALVEQLPSEVKYFKKKLSKKLCPELYSYGVQKAWWGKYAYAMLSPFISFAQVIKKLFSKKCKYDTTIAFSGHINDLSFVAKNFIKAKQKICWSHGNILSYFAICDAYPILYKKIDKFVVLSSAGQKDVYAGHKFMYDKKIYKIYNPTFIQEKSVDQCEVANLKETYGDFMLMVARMEERKGQNYAIDIVKKLKDSGYNKHLVFIGNGEMLEYYKKYAVEQGVSNYCHFIGEHLNTQDYYAAAYINLLTSKWEGLPTVIVEGMTMGKPCVMTNTDDGEVSANGKYCLLRDVGDVDGLVNDIKALYDNDNMYHEYVQLSLQRAKDFNAVNIRHRISAFMEINENE